MALATPLPQKLRTEQNRPEHQVAVSFLKHWAERAGGGGGAESVFISSPMQGRSPTNMHFLWLSDYFMGCFWNRSKIRFLKTIIGPFQNNLDL